MEVKNIVKKVLLMLQNDTLYNKLNSETPTYTQEETSELNLIVGCINLIQQHISTNYFNLIENVELNNTYDVLPFSKITNKQIYKIINIKNNNNNNIHFVIKPNGIVTNKGHIVIKYSYFANDVAIYDNISMFPIGVNERIFLFGVLGEYNFIKGNFDEAKIWEDKFKTEMEQLKMLSRVPDVARRNWLWKHVLL